MTRNAKFKYQKSRPRCYCCGRLIHSGTACVIREHCVDFLRKEGAQVNEVGLQIAPWRNPQRWSTVRAVVFDVFVLFIFLALLSFVSAAPENDAFRDKYIQDLDEGSYVLGSTGLGVTLFIPCSVTCRSVYLAAFMPENSYFADVYGKGEINFTQYYGGSLFVGLYPKSTIDAFNSGLSTSLSGGVAGDGYFYVIYEDLDYVTGVYLTGVYRIHVDIKLPSSNRNLFYFDFKDTFMIIFFIVMLALAVVLMFFSTLLSGILFFVLGTLLQFNKINTLFSVLFMCWGIILLAGGKK